MMFNINSTALVQHTNRLEKMHRSALPNAVRNTLNNAVYDVKTNSMPKQAGVDFTKRQPNFFKSQSKFENAKGFNVDSMKATVGFVEGGLKGGNNYAVKDLEAQEHGGSIDKKAFIPLNESRTGKSYSKSVKSNVRLTNIDRLVNARNQKGKNKAEKFVKAILKAGNGGFVLGSEFKGQNILYKVTSVRSNIKSRKLQYKLIALYDYQKGRSVKVKSTHFMEEASLKSAQKMEVFFINNARKEIDKLK